MYNPIRYQRSHSHYINGKLRFVSSIRNKESSNAIIKEVEQHIEDLLRGGVIVVSTYEKQNKRDQFMDILNHCVEIVLTNKDNNKDIKLRDVFSVEYTKKNMFIFGIKDDYIIYDDEDVFMGINLNITTMVDYSILYKDYIDNEDIKLPEVTKVETIRNSGEYVC